MGIVQRLEVFGQTMLMVGFELLARTVLDCVTVAQRHYTKLALNVVVPLAEHYPERFSQVAVMPATNLMV